MSLKLREELFSVELHGGHTLTNREVKRVDTEPNGIWQRFWMNGDWEYVRDEDIVEVWDQGTGKAVKSLSK